MNRDEGHVNSSILLEFDEEADHFGNQIRVRFRAGDRELLVDYRKAPFSQPGLPLLVAPFANFGMACLRLAKNTGRAALELDDYGHELLFKMREPDILICSTLSQVTVAAPYETLFNAWLTFAREVRRVVTAKHPERASGGWWNLIDEYPSAAVAQELTSSSLFNERPECF